ncbi:MAG TPA: c-type cytochrome [Vicinamibacteria bacterium]|nr:c-type cytochrome [Vicinamibacteria bacterium]
MAKPEPGRDPQMVERTQKLNVLFALTSIGMLLAFSAMVWDDYDREWKKHQIAFNRLEIQQTQKQREAALGQVAPDKRKALEDRLAQGQQEMAARQAEIRKARADASRAHDRWYAIDQDYRFTKADIDVKRYEYEEAVHRGHARAAEKRKAELDGLEKKWGELRLKLEEVSAQEAAANANLAELERTFLEADKAQKEAFAEYTRLTDRLQKIEEGFVFQVRNLPVLDMANPSLKVQQIMPANLYDDVIFSPTPKVDRCTTCHLGIDKKGYENAPQPYTAHPDIDLYLRGPHPLEKVGCTVCHQGRGRATSFVNAVHTPSSKEQEHGWGKYSGTKEYERWHLWDQPMLAKGTTESQCLKCHQGVVEVPRASKLNAGMVLVERYGCFGCHKIKGWENLRKVGPDLSKVASKTSEDWIYRWIKEPRAFRPTRMPQQWGVRTPDKRTPELDARDDAEANAAVAYLMDRSARVEFPRPPQGDREKGRRLFESVGCLGCHRVGDDRRGVEGLAMASFRTHGPNLDGSGSKLDPGWVYSWIRNPKRLWPETRMPDLRLTDAEAADITAYLMSLKSDGFLARPRPALDAGRRDAMVREYLLAQYPVKQAEEKLAAMDDRQRTLFLGERTIFRAGCFGCHMIPGFEKATPIGTELTEQGSKLVERLDFGFQHEKIPHTLPAWLHQKLMEPRIFDVDKEKKPDELLRMPKFHVTSEEADAIVTAVLSFTKEQIPLAAQRQLSADDRLVERGRRLVRDYNCRGCHQIGEQGGSIRAVVEDRLEKSGGDPIQGQALSPPMLWNASSKIGEGARVHTPWLHGFLKSPADRIRPWLEVRMPSFDFTEEQLNTITQYFAAQDRVPYPYEPRPRTDAAMVAAGRDLFGRWQCVKCHVVAGKLPDQDPANMAPDLAKVPERLRAEWLSHWLADPGRIMPGTRMPANFPVDPSENAFPEILGGDQGKQIEAVRAYLLTLGPRGAAALD